MVFTHTYIYFIINIYSFIYFIIFFFFSGKIKNSFLFLFFYLFIIYFSLFYFSGNMDKINEVFTLLNVHKINIYIYIYIYFFFFFFWNVCCGIQDLLFTLKAGKMLKLEFVLSLIWGI